MALTGCLQVGEERLGPVDDAPEVDVHQPLEVLVGHGLDGGAQSDAGVVDDQVHLAVVVHDFVGPGVHGDAVGDVEALGADLHSKALAEGDGLGQADFIDVGQGEVGAAGSEIPGKGPTDARGGAGDGGDTAIEGLHDRLLSEEVAVAAVWRMGLDNTMAASSMLLILSAR